MTMPGGPTARERAAAKWFGEQEAKRVGAKRLYRERLKCPQCGPQIRLALGLDALEQEVGE